MKYFKCITSGAVFALLLAGCSDELDNKLVVLPVSGDEIQFGAAPGGFTDVDPTTRTIYDVPEGSTFNDYTLLNIKWQYGTDQVRVYCPQGANGFQTADYTVQENADTSTGYLVKNGETGVRWGDTNVQHDFYAFYSLGKIDEGLQNGTIVTATIPTAQEGGDLKTYDINTQQESVSGTYKVITPDMTFCMMAGKGTWSPETDKNVALTFTPIVTVLDVLVNGPSDVASMKIASVSVRSKSGKNIVGTFSYDLSKEGDGAYDFTATDNSQTATSIATVETINKNTNSPVEIKSGEQLNVKFFLLPRDIAEGDLVVSVFAEGGYVYNKTVTGVGSHGSGGEADGTLEAGLITRIKTPKLGGQQPNNWMSLIPNNVLFTQLSLPGSKHSYANTVDESYNPDNGISNFYQSLPVANTSEISGATTSQFDQGVRVFDVHLNLEYDGNGATPLVYAGGNNINNGNYSLENVLDNLYKKLYPTDDALATECVVLFLNFVHGGTSNVGTWMSAVMHTLDNWDSSKGVLETLTATSTMESMRGKIAVILLLRDTYTPSGTASVNYINEWSTDVQNIEVKQYNFNGSTPVRVQNLQQCNNPGFTSKTSAGNFGYREGIGLVPYFITKLNYENSNISCNLLETKQLLARQINQEIASGTGNMYINDLSGFCVTKNSASTGYESYRRRPYSSITNNWATLNISTGNQYDYAAIPDDADYYQSDTPSGSRNQIWYEIPYGTSYLDLGNGGNSCLFAEKFNPLAVAAYSNLVGDLRQPLGIVLMNFAGVATVQTNNSIYQVQGIRLPGLIMMNNFMFPLKTGETTAQSSATTTYSKGGDVWD